MARGWFERSTHRHARHGIGEAAHAAADAVGRVTRVAHDGADRALDRSVDAYRRGNRAVTARIGGDVVPALLLSALAGFALGCLVGRRG